MSVALGGFFYADGALVDYIVRLTGTTPVEGGTLNIDDQRFRQLSADLHRANRSGQVAEELFPHGDHPCNGHCHKAIESLADAAHRATALAGIPHTIRLLTLALPKE